MAYQANHHWLRKWLRFEPHQVIGDGDKPYLRRWYIIPRNPFVNLYLHNFRCSDDDRALHDHPWWFFSLVLKGGYYEHRLGPLQWRPVGSIAFRRPTTAHRVELESEWVATSGERRERPAWTIILTGPRTRRWGFYCPQGWKFWQDFVHDNGCGEP
jgi:hypothetical protein